MCSVWRWVTYITPQCLCREHHPPALRTDSIRTHLPASRCSSLGELSCASPVYASRTLRRRRWPLAGFLWCFVLLQPFLLFRLLSPAPAAAHSQCFWTALLGIVLLTWGPWLPLFSAVCIRGVLTILLVLCCGCLPRQHGSDKP